MSATPMPAAHHPFDVKLERCLVDAPPYACEGQTCVILDIEDALGDTGLLHAVDDAFTDWPSPRGATPLHAPLLRVEVPLSVVYETAEPFYLTRGTCVDVVLHPCRLPRGAGYRWLLVRVRPHPPIPPASPGPSH